MSARSWKLVLLIAAAGVLCVLSFTRTGAYLTLETLRAFAAEPTLEFAAGPLHPSAEMRADGLYDLPANLVRASGIERVDDTVYVSTDHGDIFVLTRNYKLVAHAGLTGGPQVLRQGAVHAITLVGDAVLAIGAQGVVRAWAKDDWRDLPDEDIAAPVASHTITGLAHHDGDLLATVIQPGTGTPARAGSPARPGAPALANLTTGEVKPIKFGPFVKEGRSASELELAGISTDGQHLFAVSRNYTSIITIDPATGGVTQVVAIDPIAATDVAVHQGRAYVTVDNGYFDPAPAIHAYDLGTLNR